MRARWHHHLAHIPLRDPLARRQTPLLLLVLVCLFALALLRLLLFFAVDQATIGTVPALVVDAVALAAPAIAIVFLHRGFFAAATMLAAVAMLITLLVATAANGLRQSGMLPLVFALPLVFTGLLLDWRALLAVAGLSCAMVIGIAILESQRSPWVGFAHSPELPVSMASIFVFVAALLVLLLGRFRVDYRRELADRLQVEATLRQSEARFATAFRSSPAALTIVRLNDGAFLDANASFLRLVGYSHDELLGQRGDALGILPDAAVSAAIETGLRDGGSVHDLEVQLRTRGGEQRDVLISLEALELDGERCVLGMALDITERKRVARDLAEVLAREQRARHVAEALHTTGQLLARPLTLDAILETLLDVLQQLIPYDGANIMLPDGAAGFRVRHWRGYERWTDPAQLMALAFDPAHKPLIEAIVSTRRSVLVPDTHQEPGWTPLLGTDLIRCWLGVPLIAGERVVGIYSIDRHHPHALTDADVRLAETLAATAATAIERAQLMAQVQGERELLAQRVAERTADLSLANAELARAGRLKDEFLANMSHELRTPLNAILGRSELLYEQIYGPLTVKQAQALTSIDASGRHLLSLINDILDLSKVEAGKVELQIAEVDVDLVCQQSRQLVAERATRKRIALSTTLDARVTSIRADELRLKQILVNLLTNAVKFTPEGGGVGLEVRGDPEQQTATFVVWDTGIGIAPEDRGRLFQPFVQLDSALNREYTGTGLGLALVLRLAELHGGSVGLESAPGRGSRFSVTLPWAQEPAGRRTTRSSPESAAPLAALGAEGREAQPLILLAEDHEENSRLLSDTLSVAGYRVVVARNGGEALALAEELRPALILMDIQMPVMDGLEAIRRLRAAGMRATPIIALTALAMRGDRERCLEAGADAYLAKPVSLRTLLTQVAAQLQAHGPGAGEALSAQ